MLRHCLGAPYFYGTPTSQVKAGGKGHFPSGLLARGSGAGTPAARKGPEVADPRGLDKVARGQPWGYVLWARHTPAHGQLSRIEGSHVQGSHQGDSLWPHWSH